MGTRGKFPARKSRRTVRSDEDALRHAVRIVYAICCVAGSQRLLEDRAADNADSSLRAGIKASDTGALFDWLIRVLSYQGVSDQAAASYMDMHGSPTWKKIASDLCREPSCPLLRNYWTFRGCGYSKWEATCSRPDHIANCPLPKDRLRNGRLNQTAFALFFFLRDVADGDFVGWIEQRLKSERRSGPGRNDLTAGRESLLEPLRHVHGVSDKVLSMALASLLLAAPAKRRRWREVGGSMIAVDTLVHKLLHRTGILHRFGSEHLYGPSCVGRNGCVEIIERVAEQIDARQFNRKYPRRFARFVQHALWRYCAQDGFAECNSVRIKDGKPCRNIYCRVFGQCDRRPVSKA